MDTIFIDNLETYGILGIHPHEQKEPQPIKISLRLSTDISKAAENDDILQSINYATLADKITEFIDKSHYYTIEALITALADEILADKRIAGIWMRIEKPKAVSEAGAVGVEITR